MHIFQAIIFYSNLNYKIYNKIQVLMKGKNQFSLLNYYQTNK